MDLELNIANLNTEKPQPNLSGLSLRVRSKLSI